MNIISIGDIYLASEKRVSVSKEQLDRVRGTLDTEFPIGYDEFMLKFGEGDFSGYLRPYPPDRILAQLSSNREWMGRDFWSDGELQLSNEERSRLIVVADTIDSDGFAFLPGRPQEIFVFPRHQTRLFKIGPRFIDLLNWVKSGGVLTEPSGLAFFQPWNDYASLRINNTERIHGFDEMMLIFEGLGSADYFVRQENSIDYFVQKYGAHANYLVLDDYCQFILTFDSGSSDKFLPLVRSSLAGKGFEITEHYRVTALPALS